MSQYDDSPTIFSQPSSHQSLGPTSCFPCVGGKPLSVFKHIRIFTNAVSPIHPLDDACLPMEPRDRRKTSGVALCTSFFGPHTSVSTVACSLFALSNKKGICTEPENDLVMCQTPKASEGKTFQHGRAEEIEPKQKDF